MKKKKSYRGTFFPASTLTAALEKLGTSRRLISASIEKGTNEVSFDTEEQFFTAYKQEPGSWLTVNGEGLEINLSSSVRGTVVSVNAPDEAVVDDILSIFGQEVDEPTSEEEAVDIERRLIPSPLHWPSLPLLAGWLKTHGIHIERESVRLARYPDTVRFRSWPPVLDSIRVNGEPPHYTIWLSGTGNSGTIELIIRKGVKGDEAYVEIELSGVSDISILDHIVSFLGLLPDQDPSRKRRLGRSAFVAHRFDSEGEQVADRLARFLALLGFDVKTGRGFSPGSVSEKVRKRIEKQSVVFVLLTPGDDLTWLTQESIIAFAQDKPLFVLRDTRVQMKPAILGDLEYISFTAPSVETCFIPILEGMRELGLIYP